MVRSSPFEVSSCFFIRLAHGPSLSRSTSPMGGVDFAGPVIDHLTESADNPQPIEMLILSTELFSVFKMVVH